MQIIQLYARVPDKNMEELDFPGVDRKTGLLTEDAYDILVEGEDTTVLMPNMEPLFIFRKNVLPEGWGAAMLPSFRKAAQAAGFRGLTNRGTAIAHGAAFYKTKLDGTPSSTLRVDPRQFAHLHDDQGNPMAAGTILGFADAITRFPFCRMTAFTKKEIGHWRWLQQYMEWANGLFAEAHPERYQVQRAMADKTNPDFVIPNTAFTTVTINRKWQTAVHQDAGDLKAGFGVMGVLGNEKYTGGYFTYPQFRVAVDIRPGDLVVNNVHEWHANTPFHFERGGERISVVMYYREHMVRCDSMTAEEQKREDFLNANPNARSYLGE